MTRLLIQNCNKFILEDNNGNLLEIWLGKTVVLDPGETYRIYFRYAEVCDELAAYKALVNHSDPVKERQHMNGIKMHFYEALEQLIHAHEDRKNG